MTAPSSLFGKAPVAPAGEEGGSGAALLAGGVVALGVALLVATGNPATALVPAIGVAVVYGFVRLPVRVTLYGLVALTILSDVSSSALSPESAPWVFPPTVALQYLLTFNLSKLLGSGALKLSGAEVVLLGLLALTGLRALAGDRTDVGARPTRIPRPLTLALLISLAAVLGLAAWGVARGGDPRQTFWQSRTLLCLPVVALLAARATRGPRDAALFGALVTAVACAKVAIGAYFFFVIARPAGVTPGTATSHFDSVLFVVTAVAWAAAAYYRPAPGRIAAAAAIGAWMLLGLVVNNRRTAYVTLGADLALMFALFPRPTKRRLVRWALYAAPVVALYLAAGRHRSTGVFAPAAMIMSVSSQDDASSRTRDIENYNLIVTLRRNPVIGSGWGHEYVEATRAYDIATVFEQYKYIAHNGVLWLFSIGGAVGFTLLWQPLVVGTFFAARAYPRADPLERTVLYAALATVVAYLVQAWADMGTQSWTTVGMLGVALAAAGKVATRTGAWAPGTPMVGAAPPPTGAR